MQDGNRDSACAAASARPVVGAVGGGDIWAAIDLEDDVLQAMLLDVWQETKATAGEDEASHQEVSFAVPADLAAQDTTMKRNRRAKRDVNIMKKKKKRHAVPCHQPPWKDGCSHGLGENRGGADKHGRRYCYECTSCGSKWNQTRPDLLSPGEDPNVRRSNRSTRVEDSRRSGGYKCRVCGGKKKSSGHAVAALAVCSCPTSAREGRQRRPSLAIPHVASEEASTSTPSPDRETYTASGTDSLANEGLVEAVRHHPSMKPAGVPLRKWKEVLATIE